LFLILGYNLRLDFYSEALKGFEHDIFKIGNTYNLENKFMTLVINRYNLYNTINIVLKSIKIFSF